MGGLLFPAVIFIKSKWLVYSWVCVAFSSCAYIWPVRRGRLFLLWNGRAGGTTVRRGPAACRPHAEPVSPSSREPAQNRRHSAWHPRGLTLLHGLPRLPACHLREPPNTEDTEPRLRPQKEDGPVAQSLGAPSPHVPAGLCPQRAPKGPEAQALLGALALLMPGNLSALGPTAKPSAPCTHTASQQLLTPHSKFPTHGAVCARPAGSSVTGSGPGH